MWPSYVHRLLLRITISLSGGGKGMVAYPWISGRRLSSPSANPAPTCVWYKCRASHLSGHA